ncbi:hypothetical protein RJ55_04000 [Drechmeria coniospora]|nr:hypothetical protein RJ55_04000 [Drechmeria coniospora]
MMYQMLLPLLVSAASHHRPSRTSLCPKHHHPLNTAAKPNPNPPPSDHLLGSALSYPGTASHLDYQYNVTGRHPFHRRDPCESPGNLTTDGLLPWSVPVRPAIPPYPLSPLTAPSALLLLSAFSALPPRSRQDLPSLSSTHPFLASYRTLQNSRLLDYL